MEKTLESPLDSKEIKPVNPKGNQRWMFTGRTAVKLRYFGHLMQRVDSLENQLMLGKVEGRWRGRQRMRWLDASLIQRHELLEVGEGQGGLACCSPWGQEESNTTWQLNSNKVNALKIGRLFVASEVIFLFTCDLYSSLCYLHYLPNSKTIKLNSHFWFKLDPERSINIICKCQHSCMKTRGIFI